MINNSLDRVLKYEYCELLLGNRKNLSKYFFEKKDKGRSSSSKCEKNAIVILKFVFEEILGWSPQEAEEKLTLQIVKNFKLKQFINQLTWPPEFNKKQDLYYVVWRVYPSYPHLDNKSITESIYEKVLNKERNYFPKEFFIGADGEERLKICIAYFARKTLSFNSELEIYQFFSDPKKVDIFLSKAKLKKYTYLIFGSPVYAVQQIIGDKKNNLIYLTFMFSYLDIQEKERKQKEQKRIMKLRRTEKIGSVRPISSDDYISLFDVS